MKITIYLFLLISTSLFSKSQFAVEEIDKQITYLTYNLQIEQADSLIQVQKAKFPNTPKYYLLEVGNELMRTVVLTEAASTDRKRLVKDSMNTVTLNLAQAAVDKFENIEMTLENKFYMGGLYGYLGRFYGMVGSWMSSFSNGKTGKNLLEEVIEKDPEFYDAYILLGMFYYYGDRMGGVIGFIASILGFSGDRDQGIEYMKLSAEKGSLTSPQATMLLAELYCRLEDNDFISVKYFKDFVKKYPNNYHIKNWLIREALDVNMAYYVKNIVEQDSVNLVDDFCKAEYYFLVGEYEAAKTYFDNFNSNKNRYWHYFKRQSYFTQALNNYFLGDSALAFENYDKFRLTEKQILKDVIRYPNEYKSLFNFSANVAKNSEIEKIQNYIDNREEFKIKRIEALFLFETGRFYFFQQNYSTAQKYFLNALDLNPEWLSYNCAKFLIESYLQMDTDIESVENLIDLIDNLDSEKLEWSAKDLEKKYDL